MGISTRRKTGRRRGCRCFLKLAEVVLMQLLELRWKWTKIRRAWVRDNSYDHVWIWWRMIDGRRRLWWFSICVLNTESIRNIRRMHRSMDRSKHGTQSGFGVSGGESCGSGCRRCKRVRFKAWTCKENIEEHSYVGECRRNCNEKSEGKREPTLLHTLPLILRTKIWGGVVRVCIWSAATVEGVRIEIGGFGTWRWCPVWIEVELHGNSVIVREEHRSFIVARVSFPANNFETLLFFVPDVNLGGVQRIARDERVCERLGWSEALWRRIREAPLEKIKEPAELYSVRETKMAWDIKIEQTIGL